MSSGKLNRFAIEQMKKNSGNQSNSVNNIQIKNKATVGSELTVNGSSSFIDKANFYGDVNISKDVTAEEDLYVGQNLYVDGILTCNGGVNINNSLFTEYGCPQLHRMSQIYNSYDDEQPKHNVNILLSVNNIVEKFFYNIKAKIGVEVKSPIKNDELVKCSIQIHDPAVGKWNDHICDFNIIKTYPKTSKFACFNIEGIMKGSCFDMVNERHSIRVNITTTKNSKAVLRLTTINFMINEYIPPNFRNEDNDDIPSGSISYHGLSHECKNDFINIIVLD